MRDGRGGLDVTDLEMLGGVKLESDDSCSMGGRLSLRKSLVFSSTMQRVSQGGVRSGHRVKLTRPAQRLYGDTKANPEAERASFRA